MVLVFIDDHVGGNMNCWGFLFYSIVLSVVVACSGFESGLKEGSAQGFSTSTGDLGALSASIDAKHKLGVDEVYAIQFTNTTNYAGLVRFEIDRSQLTTINGQEDIDLSITPAELNVQSGEDVNLFLNISTPFQSPSFSNQQIAVLAKGENGQQSELKIPLTVEPIVEVQLKECDYQNNATLDECWNAPGSIDLRAHSSGVTLQFTNCDPTSSHIVHGNGPIRHQPTNQPLPQATSETNCAGSYRVQVAADETGQGSYYMHDTQGGGQRRLINFGVQNPLAARAASVADRFDRGPSNAGSCHDPVGQD